jgi:hypothetical protein
MLLTHIRPNAARLQRIAAVLAGALLTCWPALYNRYPLLYNDSIDYLGEGRPIAQAIFFHRLADLFAMRSEIYSLGILALHWNWSPWPIVLFNALLTSYVAWLVVRSILPRNTISAFLAIMALLSLLTSLSWYVSFIMPDILGALLYLCIYLLVFARDTLSRAERWSLAPIAWWAVAAHSTHLLLSVGVCILLALLLLLRWKPMLARGRSIAEVAAIVTLAAGTLLALHAYLYRTPSLDGNHPPYLMARILADGPGAWYLQAHCATLNWAICANLQHLPKDNDAFLWDDGGIWNVADAATQQRLLQEEMPLVRATLAAYPGAQLSISLANFRGQLNDFGVESFTTGRWMEDGLRQTMPASGIAYQQSLQAREALPSSLFTSIQRWAVFASALALTILLPLASRRQPRLLALAVVLIPAIVANALVTGVLSTVDCRYQARVIWLIPLLALLCALNQLAHARDCARLRNP